MHDSLVNQLVIKAWDIVMSQLLVCEVDVRKELAIGELAALMRATSSDQMLTAARAVARRWKGRDTSGLHKAACSNVLAELSRSANFVDDAEDDLPLLGGSPSSEAFTAREEAVALLIGQTISEVERVLILSTLRRVGGNRTHAATLLGISLRTLRNKLRQYAREGAPIPPSIVASAAAVRRDHGR